MRTEFPSRQVSPTLARPPGRTGLFSLLASFTFGTAEAIEDVAPPKLFRFLHGLDGAPRAMSDAEVHSLGDRFSRDVLLAGKNPLTLRELEAAVAALQGPALPLRRMFLVAEGAQFASSGITFEPNARLVFTWQASNARPPDLLASTVSAADDPTALLQLIAWSDTDQAFHFFERKGGAWGWAGNSFHALSAPTRGQGPFDSHINGGLVMKELKAPWAHWHSMNASIDRRVFGPQSEFNTDPLFADLEGAQLLENIVRAGIGRWTRGRFARDLGAAGLGNLTEYMRQVLWCTSINLASATRGFGTSEPAFVLPTTFFYDVDAIAFLAEAIDLGVDIIPARRLEVDAALYRAAIAARGIGVFDDSPERRRVAGDTHFAFLVPERAFEDQAILMELVTRNVLSARLGLALLLVDFSNPVFSPMRAALLRHVPAIAAAGAGGAALDVLLVDSIRAAAAGPGSSEAEFLSLWDQPDLLDHAAGLLAGYHAALEQRLATAQGVADLVDLAESRREAVRSTRQLVAEFQSTLAQGATPQKHLAMRPDATITAKTTSFGEGEL